MTGGCRLALAALLALGLGCSSGGGSVSPIASDCLGFAGTLSPADGSVTARQGATSCDSTLVEVVVTGVVDVFEVDFTFTFDSNFARYEGVDASIFLREGTTDVEVFEDEEGPGRVVIGLTRLGADTGVDAVGSEVVAEMLFTRLADAGRSDADFEVVSILGSEATPPKNGVDLGRGDFVD